MLKEISDDHPLRALFRWATQSAFRFHRELHTEGVEAYLSEWLMVRFVHVDSIYMIKTARGKRLCEMAEMLSGGAFHARAGRHTEELAVHQQIGDYVLFMVGVFPEGLTPPARPDSADSLLVKVGSLFYPCASHIDYCIMQGGVSYAKASELMRRLSDDKAGVLERLSAEFPAYVNLMSLVKLNLETSRCFRKIKDIIGSG